MGKSYIPCDFWKFILLLYIFSIAYLYILFKCLAGKKLENYHKALEYLNRAVELQPDFIHAKALQKLILTKYIEKL